MIRDFFNTKKYNFRTSTDSSRLRDFEGFTERIEKLDDEAWLLFQINKSSDRYFVTFCVGAEEICYVSIDKMGKDVVYHLCDTAEYDEDEISESKLFETIEGKSPYFVEWFLFNIVGIETET